MKKKCPICESKRTEYDGYYKDSGRRWIIYKCKKCGYTWQADKPEDD